MTKSSAAADPTDPPGRPHPAAQIEADFLQDCQVRRQRRSGPGGQHRNKVETAVVVTHLPTGVRGEASERREQEVNRRQALFRLRVNLALEVRLPAGRRPAPFVPSELWSSRCQSEKIRVNAQHDDFPALLAEALDAMETAAMDARQAADWLQCTSSQLIRFMQMEPRAIEQVNRQRKAAGKNVYR